MAATVTLVGSGSTISNDVTYTTAAITTVSGKEYRVVWFVQHEAGSTSPAPTWANSASLTRVDVTSAVNAATDYAAGIFVHQYKVVTGASTTFTLNIGVAFANIFYRIYEVAGEDTTSSLGGTATGVSGVTNGAFNLTLSASPVAGDVTLEFLAGVLNSGVGSVDQHATFTEEFEASTAGELLVAGAYRTGSTSTAAGWADVSNNAAPVDYYHNPIGLAFTIKAAGGGGGSSNAPRAMNQYRQRRAA